MKKSKCHSKRAEKLPVRLNGVENDSASDELNFFDLDAIEDESSSSSDEEQEEDCFSDGTIGDDSNKESSENDQKSENTFHSTHSKTNKLPKSSTISRTNEPAILASLNRIRLPYSKSLPFHTHNSVCFSSFSDDRAHPSTSSLIPDPNDDLLRELQICKQTLAHTCEAKKLLLAENVPFFRPPDYFAEMLKSEQLMSAVRQDMVERSTAKLAAVEAKTLRQLKKVGKKIQIQKELDRAKERRAMKDKLEMLRKKKAPVDQSEVEDMFSIELDRSKKNSSKFKSKSGSIINSKNTTYSDNDNKKKRKSPSSSSALPLSKSHSAPHPSSLDNHKSYKELHRSSKKTKLSNGKDFIPLSSSSSSRSSPTPRVRGPNPRRVAKNKKYGFGGKKR